MYLDILSSSKRIQSFKKNQVDEIVDRRPKYFSEKLFYFFSGGLLIKFGLRVQGPH